MKTELWQLSASALAQLIRQREASSREVVEAHLTRIEAVNPQLNAITVVLAESAREAADLADRTEPTGPLHGVPFTVKENIDCVGSATTDGLALRVDAMPALDAPVVERMKAAGGIPLARTNLPEMGLRVSTDNPLRGLTLNPWNAELTAGGSSGGEGSALASGMSPLGLGNDIGGSLRNPAFCCGIASLKPSPGRVPHAACIDPTDGGIAFQVMAVHGPMARHVEDLRLAYTVLSGRHFRDPESVDAPLRGPACKKRVALVSELPGFDLPESTGVALRRAGEALADQGFEIVDAAPPELERVHEIWGLILTMDFEPMLPELAHVMSEGPLEMLRIICQKYPPSSVRLPDVHAERRRLSRLWSEFFQDFPILISPTWTDRPFRHGADLEGVAGAELVSDRLRFITPANVLGLPAAAIPTGLHEGQPTGVQVYADRWREDLTLDAAEAIESALGRITPVDPMA
ncbi:MAG: amidase [Myxococcota bacterium]|nr:amidase [Myxococcota bacterium]